MTASRSSCKRLHSDSEDDDNEFMPVSKRVFSFHMKPQSQGLSSQNGNGVCLNALDGDCDITVVRQSSRLEQGFDACQPFALYRHKMGSEHSSSACFANTSDQGHSVSYEVNRQSMSAEPVHHPSHPVCGLLATSSIQQHRVELGVGYVPSQHQMLVSCCHKGTECMASDTCPGKCSLSRPPFFESSSNMPTANEKSTFDHETSATFDNPVSVLQSLSPFTSKPGHSFQRNAFSPFQEIMGHGSQNSCYPNEQSSVHSGSHADTSEGSIFEELSGYSQEFHLRQLPNGPYDPELGMEENPHYFSINQVLFEAHVDRVRRDNTSATSS